MPLAELRGLVVEESRMSAERHLLQGVAELEVGRRGEHRIRLADDEQHLHSPGIDVDDQLPKSGVLLARHRLGRGQVAHRLAAVAEQLVDCVGHGVDGGRLRLSGHDQRRAAMRCQVLGDGADVGLGAGRGGSGHAADADGGGHGAGEGVDLACLERQAVIGTAASDRRRGLDHVEAAQPVGIGVDTAARGEGASVLHAEGVLGGEEIGVERQDDVGLLKVVDRLNIFAEGQAGAGAGVVPRRRIPLHPLRFRMLGQDLLDLRG